MHDLSGVLVIVPAVLLVVGAGRAVDLFARERDRLAPPPPAESLAALARPLPDLAGPRGRGALVVAAGAALLVLPLGLRSPPPCPVEPPALPDALLGEPGRSSPAEDRLVGSLRPDRLEVREYGRAHGYRSVAFAIHYHQLDVPWSAFEHTPEVCHSVSGWTTLRSERVQLRGGEVLRLELARGDLRRLAHAAYLAPDRPPTPSLLGAWTRSIADGALGRPNGATLVVLSSADLRQVTDGVRRRETRGMEALLRHLEGPRP